MPRGPKERILKRIEDLQFLIESLDALRVGLYADIGKVEKTLTELKLKDLPVSSKRVVAEARAILEIPKRSPEYKRLEKLNSIANPLLIVGLVGLVIASIVLVLNLDYTIYLCIMFFVLASVNIAYIIKVYISQRISRIYMKHADELELRGGVLKKAIEHLIVRLRDEIRKLGIDPTTYKLSLRNPDYRGLRVVKKPGLFRSRYVLSFER